MADDQQTPAPELIKLADHLRELIAAMPREPKKKDIWDRFASISGFLAAMTAAIIGGVFTYVYQDQQRRHDDLVRDQQRRQEEALQHDQSRLQQLQTIAQFMPYLTSDDENKQRVAITAIQTLANTEIALNLARLNPSKGVQQAVANIATSAPSPKDRLLAASTLDQIRCGVERWSPKTLANNMRSQIDMKPRPATVAELVALDAPKDTSEDSRLDGTEKQTFLVRAHLVAAKREADSDYHLVLADLQDPAKTMVAEIPDPGCATTSGLGDVFMAARQTVEKNVGQLGRSAIKIALPVEVAVSGVGFFDHFHGQMGMARNGIELHPVLSIVFSASSPDQ